MLRRGREEGKGGWYQVGQRGGQQEEWEEEEEEEERRMCMGNGGVT